MSRATRYLVVYLACVALVAIVSIVVGIFSYNGGYAVGYCDAQGKVTVESATGYACVEGVRP